MAVNPLAFYQNQSFNKLNQKMAISYIVAQSMKAMLMFRLGLGALPEERGQMTAMEDMGLGMLQSMDGGGYALAYRLAQGLSGSAALPDANGSVTYAGSEGTTLTPVQFSPTYFYANAQVQDGEVIRANSQFSAQQWINWMATKEAGPQQSIAHCLGACYSTTGENYNYDAVQAVQTITDATTEFEFQVLNAYRFHKGQEVEIQNGSGAPYANLGGAGIVTHVDYKFGPSTIKIKWPNFVSSTSVAVNDPINMAGGYRFAVTNDNGAPNGWRSAALDSSYPRDEANNVQVNGAFYRAYNQNVNGQTISPEMLANLNAALEGQVTSQIGAYKGGFAEQARWQTAGGALYSREWYNTHPTVVNQMAMQRYQAGNENSPVPVVTQEFFEDKIQYTTFNGIPFMADKQTDIWELYLQNMAIWGVGILKPYGPLQAATTAGWQNNAGSITSHWMRNFAIVAGVLNRDRLGYLYKDDKSWLGRNPYLAPGNP